jgi:hypothetical protein
MLRRISPRHDGVKNRCLLFGQYWHTTISGHGKGYLLKRLRCRTITILEKCGNTKTETPLVVSVPILD